MLPSKGAVVVEQALSALNTHSSLHRNCFPTQPCSWQQRCLVADCASGGRVCDKQVSDGNRDSCVKQRAVSGVSGDDAAGERGWTGDWLSPNLQVAHWVRRRQVLKRRARFWHSCNNHGSTVAGFLRFKYKFDLRNTTLSLCHVLNNVLLVASAETTRLAKEAGLVTGCRQISRSLLGCDRDRPRSGASDSGTVAITKVPQKRGFLGLNTSSI